MISWVIDRTLQWTSGGTPLGSNSILALWLEMKHDMLVLSQNFASVLHIVLLRFVWQTIHKWFLLAWLVHKVVLEAFSVFPVEMLLWSWEGELKKRLLPQASIHLALALKNLAMCKFCNNFDGRRNLWVYHYTYTHTTIATWMHDRWYHEPLTEPCNEAWHVSLVPELCVENFLLHNGRTDNGVTVRKN